ncbi:hypothetical protein [Helicobacter sp. UBA3407]|nr:hypothetical protein [Helicobacter sp. UBA3407]
MAISFQNSFLNSSFGTFENLKSRMSKEQTSGAESKNTKTDTEG